MQKRTSLLLFIGFCVLALWTYRTLTPPSEEQKIRQVLQEVERSAEKKKLLRLLSYIADEYEDDMGFDKASLARIGHGIFNTYQHLFVHLRDLSIQVNGDQAQARFVAVVLASRAGGEGEENLLTERGSDRFLVTFRKMDRAWKIVKAEIPPSTFD